MRTRIWIGLLFVLVGIGFLLQQAGFIDFSSLLKTWWPIIFILIGISALLERSYSSLLTGGFFMIIGALLILNQWTDFNLLTLILPLVLISIGLAIIFSRSNKKVHVDDNIQSFSLFSTAEISSRSTNFQRGTVTTIFGSAEINLRDAIIADGAEVEVTTFFGGVVLYLPEKVKVNIRGLPIFGDWEDKTKRYVDDVNIPLLEIHCVSIFGGLEVKN